MSGGDCFAGLNWGIDVETARTSPCAQTRLPMNRFASWMREAVRLQKSGEEAAINVSLENSGGSGIVKAIKSREGGISVE